MKHDFAPRGVDNSRCREKPAAPMSYNAPQPPVSAPSLSFESLRCFLAAARLLNFRNASRAVALTPAAFGQRIRQLEEQLGVELFARTTRSVSLTERGIAL